MDIAGPRFVDLVCVLKGSCQDRELRRQILSLDLDSLATSWKGAKSMARSLKEACRRKREMI